MNRLIREPTGTMAATLSAEEEQVGLGSFCSHVFSFRVTSKQKMFQSRPYLEVFWPCALRARNEASGDVSAQRIPLRNGPESKSGNIVSISGAWGCCSRCTNDQFLSSG